VVESVLVIPPSKCRVCVPDGRCTDVYTCAYDPHHPSFVSDESNKQLLGEKIEPLPMEPGEPQRYDYQYERNVCNLFMFFEPLTAWRHVSVTHRRTAADMRCR